MVIVDETIELTVTLRREGGARGAVEVQNKPEQLAKQQDCFVLQVSKVQLERYKRRTLTTVQMLMDTSTYTNMRVAKVACVCTLAGHRECPNCFERQATHLPEGMHVDHPLPHGTRWSEAAALVTMQTLKGATAP